MSIIAILLRWTGLPQWAMEMVAVAAISGGLLASYAIWHHKVYQAGIAAQQHADAAASTALLEKVQAADNITLAAQVSENAQLEKTNASLHESNTALASSFANGLRDAFRTGDLRALSAVHTPTRRTPPTPTSGAANGAAVQDFTEVLSACAKDDATLTSLQRWASAQVHLFSQQTGGGN